MMKTTLVILALFMLSFSFESSKTEHDSPEQAYMVWIMHKTGNGFVEILIPGEALQSHLDHGDEIACLPPCRP